MEEVVDQLYYCLPASDLEDEDWVLEVEDCLPAKLTSYKHWPLFLRVLHKNIANSDAAPYDALKDCFRIKGVSNATYLSIDGGLMRSLKFQ